MDGTSARSRKSVVRLSDAERQQLEQVTRNGVTSAKRIMHARVLLMADADHPLGRYTDAAIAGDQGVSAKTVARVRQRFCRGGLAPAVDRKRRAEPPTPRKLDGRAEAQLVATCCSEPPAGRARWTLSLLADALVERKVVASVCRETVRKTLKKTSCGRGG